MATPGMCKAMGLLALMLLSFLVISVVVPTMIAASLGGPIAGLLTGLGASWFFVRNSTGRGNKRVVCTSAGLAGLCGGLAAWKLGGLVGLVGIACGALATLTVFLVLFFALAVIVCGA